MEKQNSTRKYDENTHFQSLVGVAVCRLLSIEPILKQFVLLAQNIAGVCVFSSLK